MKYPLVHIVWDDAAVLGEGWKDSFDPKPQLVDTVGFLIKETEDHVVVASTVSLDEHTGHFQIPRLMIKSIRQLRFKLGFVKVNNKSNVTNGVADKG